MAISEPVNFNYLYRFEGVGAGAYLFTGAEHAQTVAVDEDDEDYAAVEVTHTMPTFSSNPSDAEIDVTFKKMNEVANLFVELPPPYSVRLTIYEYDRDTEQADEHWQGYLIRPSFDFFKGTVTLRCKTGMFALERESVTDSVSGLSRYSVFDERSGVDVEAFRISVAVSAMNDMRDILTVTGITEIDGWFTGGVLVAPDGDQRTVLKHVTEGGNKRLYIAGGFLSTSLAVGETCSLYAGDDLKWTTWVNKFSAGQKFGGWPHTPADDPAVVGFG